MRIAYYAPMKPPSAPRPSGDRRMARQIAATLSAMGHDVELASRFRSRDGAGDATRQGRLRDLGLRLADRLIRRYRARPVEQRPALWLTYHLYHKAPDWIGPTVARALNIPYVVVEASFAPKQHGGRWDLGHQATRRALEMAAAVLHMTTLDAECLKPVVGAERLFQLPPVLDHQGPFNAARSAHERNRAAIARAHGIDPDPPWLVAVAMMREGDKLASFRELGDALALLSRSAASPPFQLLIAGDGPARDAVADCFARVSARGSDRVHLLGAMPTDDVAAVLGASDIYVWPAVREAYGMAFLEAQAAGLPVVAGRVGGVPDVVLDGITGVLTPPGDVAAFADALKGLLIDPTRQRRMGDAALRFLANDRNRARAMKSFDIAFARVLEHHGHRQA